MSHRGRRDRLETPAMAGFRHGMSSCGAIAHKLETIYPVPTENPAAIETVLIVLDTKFCATR